MPTPKLLYTCSCGWECYTEGAVAYHQAGTCKRMRQLMNLMVRREQQGLADHTGLSVGGLTIDARLTPPDTPSEDTYE